MKDNEQAIVSSLILFLSKLPPEVFEICTVRELVHGYFSNEDKLAETEKIFQLTGEPNEVH